MTDSITVDSLAHDFIQSADKRGELVDAFDQDVFEGLASRLMHYCLMDYANLPYVTQTLVFSMAEIMAKKELGQDFDLKEVK